MGDPMNQNLYNTADTERQQNEKDILFADWSEDRQSGSPQPLRAWLNRYPQHADELIGWAADAPTLECALENAAPDVAGEAHTLAIGRTVLAEMRTRYFAGLEAAPRAVVDDLIQAAKGQGLTPKTLAAQIGVGLPMIAKLQQRLIRLSTIPEELVNRLAQSLDTGAEQVRAYLSRPTTLAAGASYKSDGVPQAAPTEDFEAAVRACTDMSAEQKQFWLKQE